MRASVLRECTPAICWGLWLIAWLPSPWLPDAAVVIVAVSGLLALLAILAGLHDRGEL